MKDTIGEFRLEGSIHELHEDTKDSFNFTSGRLTSLVVISLERDNILVLTDVEVEGLSIGMLELNLVVVVDGLDNNNFVSALLVELLYHCVQ